MTTQDNNEAASAVANEAKCRKACDICFDEVGNEWPCVKAKTGKFAASAPAAFADYMVKHYPAGTVIGDPLWHVPRIYRAAIQAASASQSSTAGAAKGGATSEEWTERDRQEQAYFDRWEGSDLAHVARQRQESAVDAAIKDAAILGVGAYVVKPDLSIEHVSSEQFRAAVAEGVDTALPEPLEIDWPQLNSQALGCGVEDRNLHDRYEAAEYGWQDGVDRAAERVPAEIYDREQMLTYGAQQREAGRREQAQRVELLEYVLKQIKLRMHFICWPAEPYWETSPGNWAPDWRKEINLVEHALHGSDKNEHRWDDPPSKPHNQIAALARQPVSEGLSVCEILDMGARNFTAGDFIFEGEELVAYVRRIERRLSVVPPATQPVSEGLTYRAALSELVEWVGDNCEWGCIPVPVVKARAILSAVPPAKAEGMSDEDWKLIETAANLLDGEYDATADKLRALILAQQAKKGGV